MIVYLLRNVVRSVETGIHTEIKDMRNALDRAALHDTESQDLSSLPPPPPPLPPQAQAGKQK